MVQEIDVVPNIIFSLFLQQQLLTKKKAPSDGYKTFKYNIHTQCLV